MRKKPRIIQTGWTRGKPRRRGDRLIEFLVLHRLFYCLFSFFVEVGLVELH